MKTLQQLKEEQMKEPAFAKEYEAIQPEMDVIRTIVVSIPAPIEPPVRSLRATIPAAQSHPSGGVNHHSGK